MDVLRAQADDAAAAAAVSWEVSTSLFGKTENLMEDVVVAIHDATDDPNKDGGVGVRKLLVWYRSYRTESTLIVLILVQLYAGALSVEPEQTRWD